MRKTIALIALILFAPMVWNSISATTSTITLQLTPDQKTTVKASLKLARRAIELQKFTRAEAEIKKVLALDPQNSEALRLRSQIREALERQREIEKSALDAAVREGSIDALNRFLKDFAGSPYCKDAQARINDFEFWTSTRAANTREAFEKYLASSKVKGYENEAKAALDNIAADEEWQQLKYTASAAALENFMVKYPKSAHLDEVRVQWALIKARDAYGAGDKTSAISYYDQAKAGGAQLTTEDNRNYSDIRNQEQFNKLINSFDLYELKNFMHEVGASSPYYTPISNRVARLTASKLNQYSTDYDYSSARSYACDNSTRVYVENQIINANNERKCYKKRLKAERRREWWRDRVRLGWNVLSFDIWEYSISLSTGLRLRFGRHTDILNLTLGMDYTYITSSAGYYDFEDYARSYGDEPDYHTLGHYITFPVNLRFNIFRISDSCKFYIGCTGEYGALISSGDFDAKGGTVAIVPTVGFNFKHGDIGLYYKRYLDNHMPSYMDDSDNQRAGMLFTWYF